MSNTDCLSVCSSSFIIINTVISIYLGFCCSYDDDDDDDDDCGVCCVQVWDHSHYAEAVSQGSDAYLD